MLLIVRFAEEAGIEPAAALFAANGFEDRGDHQIPSASENDDRIAGPRCQHGLLRRSNWSDHSGSKRGGPPERLKENIHVFKEVFLDL